MKVPRESLRAKPEAFVITLICELRILFVICFASVPGISYNYTMFSFQIMLKCKINN